MNVSRLEIQLFATGLGFLLLGFAAGANAFAGAEYLRIVSGFDPASQLLAAAFLLAAAAAGAAAVRAVRIEDAFLVAGAALGGAALLAVYFNDLIWHVHAASVESGRGALGRLGLFLLPTGIQTLLVAAAGSAGLGRILGEHADGQARARIAGRFVFALALGSAAGAGAAAVIALLVGLLVLPFLAGCILAGLGLLCWVAHHRLESPSPAGRPDAAADRLLIGAGALGLLVLMGSLPLWLRTFANAFGPLPIVQTLGIVLIAGVFAFGLRSGFRKREAASTIVAGRALLLLGLVLLAGLFLQEQLIEAAANLRWRTWTEQQDGRRVVEFLVAVGGLQALLVYLPAFCAGVGVAAALRGTVAVAGAAAAAPAAAAILLAAACGLLLCLLVLPAAGIWGAQAAAAGLAVAAGLAAVFRDEAGRRVQGGLLAAAALIAVVVHAAPDARTVSAGHYIGGKEAGQPLFREELIRQHYHADGTAAGVSVLGSDALRGVNYNGVPLGLVRTYIPNQPDANLRPQEILDALTALLPAAAAAQPERAAVAGFGSGLVPAVLLARRSLAEVHVAEPEARVVEAAAALGPQVAPALEDARSMIHISSPALFFDSRPAGHFDIIVVTYDKPWVAGWAGYFTDEHFARMRRALAADGHLVQRIDLELTDEGSTARMMSALAAHFPKYEVFMAADSLIILAGAGRRPPADPLASDRQLAAAAARIGIKAAADLDVFRLGDSRLFAPLFASYNLAPPQERMSRFANWGFVGFARGSHNPIIELRKLENWIFNNDILAGAASAVSGSPETEVALSGRHAALAIMAAADAGEFVGALDAALADAGGGEQSQFPVGCADRKNLALFIVAFEERISFAESFMLREEKPALWEKAAAHLTCYRKAAADAEAGSFFAFWEEFSRHNYQAALRNGAKVISDRDLVSAGDTDVRLVLKTMLAAVAEEQYSLLPQLYAAISPHAPDRYQVAARLIFAHAFAQETAREGAPGDAPGS